MGKRATPSAGAKRVPLMARTTTGLRAALDAAASASGRSLAQEVETRLEASFRNDDLRTMIREEIRAALAEAPPKPDLSDFREPMSPYETRTVGGQSCVSAAQVYDRSALMARPT